MQVFKHMTLKTQTYATFLFIDTPDDGWEYRKISLEGLDDFTKEDSDILLEPFLEKLLAEKPKITAANVHRIEIHHTVFYETHCWTDFSPRILEIMAALNATFCLNVQRIIAGENLYDFLDLIRTRPGMWLGESKISLMQPYIEGFLRAQNGEIEHQPPFGGFHDFVGNYFGRYSTPGWKNMILEANNGDENEALNQFFVLLDAFRVQKNK
jgi:hypothetical protein